MEFAGQGRYAGRVKDAGFVVHDLGTQRDTVAGDRLLLNEGGARFVDASDRLPPSRHRSSDAALIDMNGDGHLDLVAFSESPGYRVFANEGGGVVP